MKKMLLQITVGTLFLLACTSLARAQGGCTGGQSITLDSDATAGVYTYFINSTGGNSTCILDQNPVISFTGMGGVTNALVQPGSFLVTGPNTPGDWTVTHTSSSANFDVAGLILLLGGNNAALEIDCSSCVTGTIDWTAFGTTDSTIAGPVAAATGVPEPASLALLGTALVGFGAIRRRRRSTPVS